MKDTSHKVVGEANVIIGQVFVKHADGDVLPLKKGDKIYEGDIVVAGQNSYAYILRPDAEPIWVTIERPLTQEIKSDLNETTGNVETKATVPLPLVSTNTPNEKVVPQKQENTLSIDELLEKDPTASGMSDGETNEGMHEAVNLARITEQVPETPFSHANGYSSDAIPMPIATAPAPFPNQTLMGTAQNDVLTGGEGNDVLRGGMGNDTLTGNLGADVFVWRLADVPAGNTVDKVTDLSSADVLDIRDLLTQPNSQLNIDNSNHVLTVSYADTSDNAHIQLIEFNFDVSQSQQMLLESGGVVKIG